MTVGYSHMSDVERIVARHNAWTQLDKVNRLQLELNTCEAHFGDAMAHLDRIELQARSDSPGGCAVRLSVSR